MSVEYIEGGVCAAQGFSAAGIHCGVRPNKNKNDLAVIFSSAPCSAAGLFTLNKVKAAPVWLDMETVKGGKARAIAANSGNANACAPEGMENALRMRAAAAKALGHSRGRNAGELHRRHRPAAEHRGHRGGTSHSRRQACSQRLRAPRLRPRPL
jgi:N-acetylglutamate synthase/N-acetylornithine aminotransferase